MSPGPRLLCIDLQSHERTPEARAVFGARQLLSIARRSSWPVIHTRMRGGGVAHPEALDHQATALRPLTTERVFLRNRRSSADCPALIEQLDQWSGETVYVAASDSLSLLSLLIDRIDRGPNFVLVDDAISMRGPDKVLAAAQALAPRITISALVEMLGYRPAATGPQASSLQALTSSSPERGRSRAYSWMVGRDQAET